MQPTVTIALRAARRAGDAIAKAAERLDLVKVEEKEANDYVTNVDQHAEAIIVEQIQKAWPEHSIIGEESGLIEGKGGSDTVWIVDPLDGTTNFMRGIPHYSISIACMEQGRLEHAVIYDPIRREEFTASRGCGVALNGRRIRVSTQAAFNGALVGTGIPYREGQRPCMEGYMRCLEELASQGSGIRRAGSAALDLAYVAAGRLDAFWEIGLRRWDIAAGLLLIQEAGGLSSDFQGGQDILDSGHIVCGNPKLFKQLLKVVNRNIGKPQD